MVLFGFYIVVVVAVVVAVVDVAARKILQKNPAEESCMLRMRVTEERKG